MTARVPRPFDALGVPLDAGVTLVEASAGTGKTFAITRLLLRLLLEKKVDSLSQVLVVTFTEKATQELVTRIRGVLRDASAVWSATPPAREAGNNDLFILHERFAQEGEAIIANALASLDDLAVSTIHGFCYRVLAESALESRIPFRTTFLEDDTEPFQRAAGDWARRRLIGDAAEAATVVASGESPADWVPTLVRPYRRFPATRLDYNRAEPAQAMLADFIQGVDNAFDAEKARRHLLGFDDLLRKLCDVLTAEGPEGPLARRIREKFKAALIDEFQDTDPTQYPIFSTAFHGCPLFLIGDPKQSIYAFRGADVRAYLHAAKAAGRRYTLLKNYRSTPGYVQAVQALFTRTGDPFVLPDREIGFPEVAAAYEHEPPPVLRNDGGAPMEWWWLDGSLGKTGKYVSKDDALRLLNREIASEIVRLNDAGLPCSSIAVLVRRNSEALQLKRTLERANIAAVIGGDTDVLASEEGEELIRLARAIASPGDGRAVRAALSTRLWGSTADEIVRLQGDGAEADWKTVLDSFIRARSQWWQRGVALSLGALLVERGAAERLLALPDGERRLTNVRHVLELFHEAWARDGIAPEGFAAWVARERTVPNTPERRELRLERDAAAVQILTIHKCKGLQFDVVFCPTLWETFGARKGPLGIDFALAPERDGRVLDLGSPRIAERRQARDHDELAESVRLAYVALTRAVHRCYVAWGEIGKGDTDGSALGWLMRGDGDGGKRAALASLVDSSGGVMRMRDIAADGRWPRAAEAPVGHVVPQARPLSLARGQLDTWQITSYSGIAVRVPPRRPARRRGSHRPPGVARPPRRCAWLPRLSRGCVGRRGAPRAARAGGLPAPRRPRVARTRATHPLVPRAAHAGRAHSPSAGGHQRNGQAPRVVGDPRIAVRIERRAARRRDARMALRPFGAALLHRALRRRAGAARVAARPRLRAIPAQARRAQHHGLPERLRRPRLRARRPVVGLRLEVELAWRGRRAVRPGGARGRHVGGALHAPIPPLYSCAAQAPSGAPRRLRSSAPLGRRRLRVPARRGGHGRAWLVP